MYDSNDDRGRRNIYPATAVKRIPVRRYNSKVASFSNLDTLPKLSAQEFLSIRHNAIHKEMPRNVSLDEKIEFLKKELDTLRITSQQMMSREK